MPRSRFLFGSAAVTVVLALTGVGFAAAQSNGARRAAQTPRASTASSAICGTTTTAPKYKHVIVLFMENNSYNQIMGSSSTPYIHSLATACALGTNYHNITHPSLPEYIAATTGATYGQLTSNPPGFDTDCTPSATCRWAGTNIFNQLNQAGRHWKSYVESMPSACDKSNVGLYAPRHNPAVYDVDLGNCAANDVALGTTTNSPLLNNFSSESTAPAYAWITPNLCDDMHGASGCPSNLLQTGDNWLKTWIPKITSTAVYKDNDTAIFLTWDEGEPGTTGENCATNASDQSCRVAMIVIAPSAKKGAKVTTLLNHYSLLKASEDLLGLPELGQAKTATSMVKPFNL